MLYLLVFLDNLPRMISSALMKKPTLEQLLQENRIILLDGGWGYQLLDLGCVETANIQQPDRVLAIAKSYVDAGSMIIGTNTFGANRHRLIEGNLKEINRKAVEISRNAAGPSRLVSGTIGPTCLDPEISFDAWHEQALILSESGADILTIETLRDPDEAAIAVKACRNASTLPIVCTFSPVEKNLIRCAQAALDAGVTAIGVNCGNGPQEMLRYVESLCKLFPNTPIVYKPNAGIPQRGIYPFSAGQFAEWVEKAIELGARMVGGCCGTDAETIRAIKRRIDERR